MRREDREGRRVYSISGVDRQSSLQEFFRKTGSLEEFRWKEGPGMATQVICPLPCRYVENGVCSQEKVELEIIEDESGCVFLRCKSAEIEE